MEREKANFEPIRTCAGLIPLGCSAAPCVSSDVRTSTPFSGDKQAAGHVPHAFGLLGLLMSFASDVPRASTASAGGAQQVGACCIPAFSK